ncbi:hypothetical protein ACKI1I_37820 [Streptomyces turgidiscabies]|uniref:Uncharacterized protein n=1 Tax=Streptomyces turgidiscabies (strain Car8) TaxID=698760 RepID=L7FAD8_STRT8|nr:MULTISPECIES: hypothetical protein [Streptomyces]ELP68026.1 hypothetical protein STRTUCAR8_05794 [Streptomyces turgidiscabies Car8]MDX3500181.1 hypothetical protein [Streptomyces turgidiscabies]GAQ77294.1 hypothetical protein T45_09112 [Streptomyces turgidiscabies]
MSPAARTPYAKYAVRRTAWLRVVVLLLALLVPGTAAHCGAAESAVSSGTAAEHDVHDTALRPPARYGHRTVVALRPVPGPPAARHAGATSPAHPLPVPPRPTPAPRSVVLRC